jgi:hypothetical protein
MKRNEKSIGKKKLTIKRETIRSLTTDEIKDVNGGNSYTKSEGCSGGKSKTG